MTDGIDFSGKSERDILVEAVTRLSLMQADITAVKNSLNELYESRNRMQSQMDTLQAEHDQRMKSGADCVVNNWQRPAYSIRELAAMGGSGGGVVGLVAGVIFLVGKFAGWW